MTSATGPTCGNGEYLGERRARVALAVQVRPGVRDAALQAVRLLLHDRGRLARPGTRLVVVAELMADLVVDRVRLVDRERRAVAGDRLPPPVQVDDDVAG